MRLLEPGNIGSLDLKNRIYLSPHGTTTAGEWGEVTDQMIAYYARRARGGAGLIGIGTIAAATEVDGIKVMARTLRIDDDVFCPGLSHLAEAVHDEGSKICFQLQVGAGAMAGGGLGFKIGIKQHMLGGKAEPVSPSGIPFPGIDLRPRELTTKEIERIVELMGLAAHRARLAGSDAVEINACGGYLIQQFISPYFNKRTDRYGGDFIARCRFLMEIVEEIRKTVGKQFPLIVRYRIGDYPIDANFDESDEIQEAKTIAVLLQEAGVDGIHVNISGFKQFDTLIPSMHYPEACFAPFSQIVKSVVNIPVILTGRLRDPEIAEQMLREGKADFIGMARPLIADPDLPKKIAADQILDIWNCIACNECLRAGAKLRTIQCAINPEAGRERQYGSISQTNEPKNVMIVGAGPAGLEAAMVAAIRGHKVTLVEKERKLGGNLIWASKLPFRRSFEDLLSYYSLAFKKLEPNLKIYLESEMTPKLIEDIEKEGTLPDVAIVATGGVPYIPIKYENGGNTVDVLDVISGAAEIGSSALIIGANIVGVETALLLAGQGREVTLIEVPDSCLGKDIDGDNIQIWIWVFLQEELSKAGVKIISAKTIEEISNSGIRIIDSEGNQGHYNAETIIRPLKLKPKNDLIKQFNGKVKDIYVIGDAKDPRKIKEAIYDGFVTAYRL